MPFNGLHPFLQLWYIGGASNWGVSMPFNGLHPFLRKAIGYIDCKAIWCQCPLTGGIHFYEKYILSMEKMQRICQCPLTGGIHFYPATWEAPVYKALKGAFSPRFFKLLQKCYILPFFCFSKILLLTCILFYHIFIINARTFLTPG